MRSSIGYFDFAPLGVDERLLREAGLQRARRRGHDGEHGRRGARAGVDVRAERAETLRRIEGDESFERRQRFLGIVTTLADERRVSRFTYLAEKPRRTA